jgi:transcriptional antiterminator NusG
MSANAKWYVVHVYSGFEHKVADAIKEQATKKGLADVILDVVVPAEEVVEVQRGRKVQTERKFFPGYILVHMEMADEAWHLVKSTPKVTGFIGGGSKAIKPIPISKAEAERIMKQINEGVGKVASGVHYDIGEQVRVTDGPFATFTGVVEDIDEGKSKLKVAVSIFGRATPVELDYGQVEKA